MNQVLNINLQNLKENLILIPSFEIEDRDDDDNLFFYHFSKTGGTSVCAFLVALATNAGKSTCSIDGKFGSKMRPPPPEAISHMPSIIYGHSLYGYHKFFQPDPSILTVLRDPVDRVVSDYFWQNRFEDEISLSKIYAFQNFLDKQTHHNLLAGSLFGDVNSVDQDVSTLKARLDNFKYVATTEGIDTLLSVIASQNGCPSICIQKGKVNPFKKLRDAFKAEFKNEIESRNHLDHELYKYARLRQEQIQDQFDLISKIQRKEPNYVVANLSLEKNKIAGGKMFLVLNLLTDQVHTYMTHWKHGVIAHNFDKNVIEQIRSALDDAIQSKH